MSKANAKPSKATPKTTAAKKPAAKKAAPVAVPLKPGSRKLPATPAKPVKAPVKKAVKPVEPVAKPGKRVTTAKVVPDPKNTAAVRKTVAKPLPKPGQKVVATKAPLPKAVKPVVGIAKSITVDQLINFAKSEKSLNTDGKFVQILQFESARKTFAIKLNAPVKVNGELVSNVKLNNTDILLLDAEAAKVFRHIDVANVTLKFKRV